MIYDCINLHFTDFCNFKCKHCFVKKENYELSFDELKTIVDKISRYFNENNIKGRINLAGGEPLLSRNICKLIDYIYSKNIDISIITNGYYLDEAFIDRNKGKIQMIGISVDSLDYETNIKIGRCFKANTISYEQLVHISNCIKSNGIKLKINTCLTKLNYKENFGDFISEIKPYRYKIFQMLSCDYNEFADDLTITEEEAKIFLSKIRSEYVFETSLEMQKSYLIIDSTGCVTTNNTHTGKVSIFDYELGEAIKHLDIDYANYIKRYV